MSYIELYFMGKVFLGFVGLLLFALVLIGYVAASIIDWWEGRPYRKLKKEARRANRNQ